MPAHHTHSLLGQNSGAVAMAVYVFRIGVSLVILGLAQIATGETFDPLLNWKRNSIEPTEHLCTEEVLAYLPQSGDLDDHVITKRRTEGVPELHREARGSADKVDEFTVYDEDDNEITETLTVLCRKGHNNLRKRHIDTGSLKYNRDIAKTAQSYAEKLAKSGKFEHDTSIRGKYGENLYRLSNTYDGIANPAHANYAWYAESWEPIPPGKKKNYNYKFNPHSSSEFHNAGVGHFTQMLWQGSKELGCGVATATYKDDGREWRRTVIVARYASPGNVLTRFPDNVKPLINGEKTLEKSLTRSKLYKTKSRCVNVVHPSTCGNWKKYGWCDRSWALSDCSCTCGKKR